MYPDGMPDKRDTNELKFSGDGLDNGQPDLKSSRDWDSEMVIDWK
jgi:hypothetical protein